MVTWNTNVPYGDTTGYVDESYFNSEIGYLSCYFCWITNVAQMRHRRICANRRDEWKPSSTSSEVSSSNAYESEELTVMYSA